MEIINKDMIGSGIETLECGHGSCPVQVCVCGVCGSLCAINCYELMCSLYRT